MLTASGANSRRELAGYISHQSISQSVNQLLQSINICKSCCSPFSTNGHSEDPGLNKTTYKNKCFPKSQEFKQEFEILTMHNFVESIPHSERLQFAAGTAWSNDIWQTFNKWKGLADAIKHFIRKARHRERQKYQRQTALWQVSTRKFVIAH